MVFSSRSRDVRCLATASFGAVAIALGAVGCAGAVEPTADVTVTEAQYRQAFENFAECMSAGGFELVAVDDSDVVIDYSFPTEAIAAGVEPECYGKFEQIDAAWQVQNSYDDASSQQVRECLIDAGITPEGTVEGEYAQLVDGGLDEECLSVPPE